MISLNTESQEQRTQSMKLKYAFLMRTAEGLLMKRGKIFAGLECFNPPSLVLYSDVCVPTKKHGNKNTKRPFFLLLSFGYFQKMVFNFFDLRPG